VPFLEAEASERPWDAWIQYRLAWALDRLEMPDSALCHARSAWELCPQNERYLGELLKSLSMLGRDSEAVDLAAYLRGGGPGRYYAASCGDSASLAYLLEARSSPDDSVAADACCWLAVLSSSQGDEEGCLDLLLDCSRLRGDDPFYREMLVEHLAGAGRVAEARVQLEALAGARVRDQGYWQARAELARAEGDDTMLLWALRRAHSCRGTAQASRDLAWALYRRARRDISGGDSGLGRERLQEALQVCADSLVSARCESLLAILGEFERQAGGWR